MQKVRKIRTKLEKEIEINMIIDNRSVKWHYSYMTVHCHADYSIMKLVYISYRVVPFQRKRKTKLWTTNFTLFFPFLQCPNFKVKRIKGENGGVAWHIILQIKNRQHISFPHQKAPQMYGASRFWSTFLQWRPLYDHDKQGLYTGSGSSQNKLKYRCFYLWSLACFYN